jgi:large subunit ribosomal protein L25
MGLINLTVHPRETVGKNENRRTRATGRIPAVLYGRGRASVNVTVDTQEFRKILMTRHGRNAIFNLTVAGEAGQHVALMREIQQHPVTDEVRHIDLFAIPAGAKVTVEVPIEFTGEPQVMKFGGGEIVKTLDHVAVSCLPREMPEVITLDISDLQLLEKRFVRDLKVSAGEIVSDGDLQVILLKPATLFAEETPAAAEATPAAEAKKPDAKKSDAKKPGA